MEAIIMWAVAGLVFIAFVVYLVLAIRGDDRLFAQAHDEDVRES